MHTRTRLAATVLVRVLVILSGVIFGAQTARAAEVQPNECPKVKAVERIDGTVTNIDSRQGVLTLVSADGTVHKFQASQETLADLKVGDKIHTKLRISEKCRNAQG